MSPEEVEEFNFPKDNAVYKTGFTMLPPKAGGMAYSAASLTGGG